MWRSMCPDSGQSPCPALLVASEDHVLKPYRDEQEWYDPPEGLVDGSFVIDALQKPGQLLPRAVLQ